MREAFKRVAREGSAAGSLDVGDTVTLRVHENRTTIDDTKLQVHTEREPILRSGHVEGRHVLGIGEGPMKSPIKFAHVVLKTTRYSEMLEWWQLVLSASVRHGNDFISFLSYDDEHHRLAIVRLPHLKERDDSLSGVEHFAFTFATLADLFSKYQQLKARGITPYWTINHGMNFSAYYRDPDGNQVELQIDAMSPKTADEFMNSPVFAANPIGVDVDFDALIARFEAGESAESIVSYPGYSPVAT
jgi:catechol 2,3-dioxygenase-like lactoylglutathione lyase family enzyme